MMTPRLRGTRDTGGDLTRVRLVAAEWLNDVGPDKACLPAPPPL